MQHADRPVWSARQLADRADVSRKTAEKRLQEAIGRGDLATLQIGNGTGYYLPGKEMQRFDEGGNPVAEAVRAYWTDRFVGTAGGLHDPSIVSTFHRNTLTADDRGRFVVQGRPANWELLHASKESESLPSYDPPAPEGYVAVITGELYAKSAVPIEHIDYDDDYDLELNIPMQATKIDGDPVLIAAGQKRHWVRPCNDAVFLQDVTVEQLDGPGPKDMEVVDVDERMRDRELPAKLLNDPDERPKDDSTAPED